MVIFIVDLHQDEDIPVVHQADLVAVHCRRVIVYHVHRHPDHYRVKDVKRNGEFSTTFCKKGIILKNSYLDYPNLTSFKKQQTIFLTE